MGLSGPRSSTSSGQLSMTSNPVSSTDFSKRKYNTSCNLCRRARVKCSGGFPCQRCATSANPSSCAYSISRRRGKRKASEPTANDTGGHVDMTTGPAGLDETHSFDPISLDQWIGAQSASWNSSEDGAQITQVSAANPDSIMTMY
jgi:hypothetical protein